MAIGQDVCFEGPCLSCGRDVPVEGGVALVGERLEWSVESECGACGPVMACGRGEVPQELRERLLAEHGAARLDGVGAARVAVLRVLRAELGVDLGEAKALYVRVLAGTYVATLPELELLARRLRVAGVESAAARA